MIKGFVLAPGVMIEQGLHRAVSGHQLNQAFRSVTPRVIGKKGRHMCVQRP